MRRRDFVSLLLLSACHRLGGSSGGDGGTGFKSHEPNPIPGENQLPGDPDWMKGLNNPWNHQLEGYLDRVSANAGDTVQVMINADSSRSASWALYRLGWYGGAGARKVMDGGALRVST